MGPTISAASSPGRLARGTPLEQARGRKPDLRVRRRHRIDEQVRRDARFCERRIARDDHRERQILDLAIAILEALAQAADAIGTECDETRDRTDPQWPVVVALGAGQDRQRAEVAELGEALACPRAHRKIIVTEQCHEDRLAARARCGGHAARTHLAHDPIVVVDEALHERDRRRVADIGERAGGALADALGRPIRIGFRDRENALHRCDRARIAALTAELARAHLEVPEHGGEREREALGIAGRDDIERFDRGDVDVGVIVLDELDQAGAHRARGRLLRAIRTRGTHRHDRRGHRREVNRRIDRHLGVVVVPGEGRVRSETDAADRILDQREQLPVELGVRLRGLTPARDLADHLPAQIGMPARRAARDRGLRIRGVPRPQRAKRFAAHLRGLVVERIAEQRVGANVQRRIGARRTHAHQDLERSHAEVLLAAAQRGLREVELGCRSPCGRGLRERIERERADLGIAIVEQPGQPRVQPIVIGPGRDREHEVRGRAAAQRRIGLAGELEHGTDGARIAEREQHARTADRGIGRATCERREQGLELAIGERLRRDRRTEREGALELLRDLIERLRERRHRRVDDRSKPRLLDDRGEKRRGAHAGIGIVERTESERARRRLVRAQREAEDQQRLGANIGRAAGQRGPHRFERRLDLAKRAKRGAPHVDRCIAHRIRDHAGRDHRGGGERNQGADRANANIFGARGEARADRGERVLRLELEQRTESRRPDERDGRTEGGAQRRARGAAMRARDRLDRGELDLGRTIARCEIEQHARFVFHEQRCGLDRRNLDLGGRAAIAQHLVEPVELRSDLRGIAGLGLGSQRDRADIALARCEPQPANAWPGGPEVHRAGRECERGQGAELRLEGARPLAAIEQPRFDGAVLARAEHAARQLATLVVDDERAEDEAAQRALVAVIARAVGGFDVADDEARAERAIATADRGAPIADRDHRADPAIAAGRHRARRGCRIVRGHDPQLPLGGAREDESRGIEAHRGDRAFAELAAHGRSELRRTTRELERDDVQHAIGGAHREHPRQRLRDVRIDCHRADRRRELQPAEVLLTGDIPRDQPAIIAAGEQEVIADERERAHRGACIERPAGALAIEQRGWENVDARPRDAGRIAKARRRDEVLRDRDRFEALDPGPEQRHGPVSSSA